MAKLTRRTALMQIASIVAGAGLFSSGQLAAQPVGELRFGLTPVFLNNDIELLEKLKTYLATATGYPIKLVQRRTYQEVTSLLISGELDAAWICGYPFVKNRERLKLVAVPVWNGKPLYQAYLITGKDRDVSSFTDLKGDLHAFSDPDSNSGYLVTRALLAELKERPESYFSSTFFTYGHRNVVRAIASGLADSGSVDGYVWEAMRKTEPDLINQTKVIRKSEWLGFPPIACSRSMVSSDKLSALSPAILNMESNADGRAALALLGLDSFKQFPPSLYDDIAAKVALIEVG